jgi:hypothetical protein
MTIKVKLDPEDGNQLDVEFESVPRPGEIVSINYGESFRLFEVTEAWHCNNQEGPGTWFYVRELEPQLGRPATH